MIYDIIQSSSEIEIGTRLPDHLILEHILPRLPVRSLLRFKSVCKIWFDTINSRQFTKSHLNFSSSRPRQLILLVNDYERNNYVFYRLSKLKSNLQQLVVPSNFDIGTHGTMEIVASYDGIVCLYHELDQSRAFYLWNPCTRQSREIDQIEEIEETEPFLFTAAYGFGYGPFIDDYNIIAVFTTYNGDFNSYLYIYSLKSGEWKRVKSVLDNYRVSTIGTHKGVTIDGRVYWPLRFHNHSEQFNSVVGFNLDTQQLEVNPWMSWLPEASESNLPLFRVHSCLSVCRYRTDSCFDVWVLKRREDWNSWEKVFLFNTGHVDFIHLSMDGKCFVHHSKQLKVVEQGQEAAECPQEGAVSGDCYDGLLWEVEDYVESFVSPF